MFSTLQSALNQVQWLHIQSWAPRVSNAATYWTGLGKAMDMGSKTKMSPVWLIGSDREEPVPGQLLDKAQDILLLVKTHDEQVDKNVMQQTPIDSR